MKQKIFISIFEDDNQFDVEAYSWNEKEECKGDMLDDLSDYAFQSINEANKHIEKISNNYEIVEIKSFNEETIDELFDFKEIEPTYKTYVLSSEELETYIEKSFYKYHGFEIKVLVCDDDFRYISIVLDDLRTSKFCVDKFKKLFSDDDTQNILLKETFGTEEVELSLSKHFDVCIHVPF